jgi:hypothetical protein
MSSYIANEPFCGHRAGKTNTSNRVCNGIGIIGDIGFYRLAILCSDEKLRQSGRAEKRIASALADDDLVNHPRCIANPGCSDRTFAAMANTERFVGSSTLNKKRADRASLLVSKAPSRRRSLL